MTNQNLGPAITSNPNSVNVLTPINATGSTLPQGSNAIRLLGSARSVPTTVAGYTPIPIVNSSRYVVSQVLYTNASTTTISASTWAAIYAGGTAALPQSTIVNAVVLGTLITAGTSVSIATVAPTTTAYTTQTLYVSIGTTVGSTVATFDVFVIGYDIS
jgi:hypothetical protein